MYFLLFEETVYHNECHVERNYKKSLNCKILLIKGHETEFVLKTQNTALKCIV